jgi:hypothetical protein
MKISDPQVEELAVITTELRPVIVSVTFGGHVDNGDYTKKTADFFTRHMLSCGDLMV